MDIAKKAERLIASKDSDGPISFSYYEHQAPAIQLQGKLQALKHYAANVDKYIKDKIDHPFYVKMDKVIYDLEQLNILDYKTTNRIGYQTTMTITDADGKRTTLPYQPSEIGLLELYKVDNPYKQRLQASFSALMEEAGYGQMSLTQEDYLVQGLKAYNFSYDSLYESQQALENLRDVALAGGAFVTYLFCPPAGAALFLALSGADLYSALSGQDWSTGRELETSERWMRGIFAAIDFIPGSDVFKAFKANGFKAAGLEYMQDLLGASAKGMVKGSGQVDELIAISDDLSEQVLKGLDPYGKQLDDLGTSTVISGVKNLDEGVVASKSFTLNGDITPPSSILDNLSGKLDDGLGLKGSMPDKPLVNAGQSLDGVETPSTTFNLNNPQGSATEVPSIKEPNRSLLSENGLFKDTDLELKYQNYSRRKLKDGKQPRERLDWKEASDYYTQHSPIARGNRFNQTVRERNTYPAYEIHLENGKMLDSYDPYKGEIISRKATDLDQIQEETFRAYLSEFEEKYSRGTKIRSNTNRFIDGMELEGEYILEIPASNKDISNIRYYEDIAAEYGVKLRYTEE